MVNSIDLSSTGRVRALALEKFVLLTLHLDNPSFYLQFDDIKKLYLRDLEANFSHASHAVLNKLLQNEDFMLHYAIASMAKNHNYFSQIDTYMKELARITIKMGNQGKHMQQRLEEALSKEIAIGNLETNFLAD
jgi:DNA-binding FadR family transcriptional regulator